jgi:hypothetical protein
MPVPLTTDVRRIWSITANATTPIVDATIDVTVTDGVESVTKRITMHAEYVTEEADAGSEMDTAFTRYDSINEFEDAGDGDPANAEANIYVKPDGTVSAATLGVDPYGGFPQNWNVLAPALTDPENYECRVTQVDGDVLTVGTLDTWFNCSTERQWGYAASADAFVGSGIITDTLIGNFKLQIREVGRPDTEEEKPFRLWCIARSYPPGIPLP